MAIGPASMLKIEIFAFIPQTANQNSVWW